jgi:hypothetical protein
MSSTTLSSLSRRSLSSRDCRAKEAASTHLAKSASEFALALFGCPRSLSRAPAFSRSFRNVGILFCAFIAIFVFQIPSPKVTARIGTSWSLAKGLDETEMTPASLLFAVPSAGRASDALASAEVHKTQRHIMPTHDRRRLFLRVQAPSLLYRFILYIRILLRAQKLPISHDACYYKPT